MRLVWLLILMLVLPLISAATLTGSIYNYGLELEKDVLVQINTTPPQKYLAKDGHYTLQVPAGSYTLIANKGFK